MPNFYKTLDHLRVHSTDMFGMGRSFERLIKTALSKEPGILGDRFSQVWMWNEWPGRDGPDIGVDLVAEEREGGLCAIQCKFFDPHNPVPKKDIDSFMSASEPSHFTSRLIVNTGGSIQKNALKTLQASPKPCRVLDKAELDGWDVDWWQYVDDPEGLQFQAREPYTPHPYQKDAVKQVLAGFQEHDRGQLVLPCGTGKTAVTLWIAEQQVGLGGRVLYLVPSIALMAQTMREWSEQKSLPLRYVGICSDKHAGYNNEDASLLELDYPVTTDLEKIQAGLQAERPEALLAVFCTYQSLPLVAAAQADGAPAFDLVVCDEAHRTTGVEEPAKKSKDDKKISPFRLVHDKDSIHAHKRIYATATPRLYTESAKGRAADRNLDIYSMNDESVYGPVFYRMAFSQAIEGDWLTDYKVIILTLKSDQISGALGNLLAAEKDSGLNLDDAVKLLGCWDALADPGGVLSDHNVAGDQHNPLLRAITFTNTIKSSKMVEAHWQKVVEAARERTDAALRADLLPLEVKHVDGTQNSLDRQRKLGWLKTEDTGNGRVCRVLSNARCLTEGVDVPALDAVLFLAPRKSQVDVVQAVGRVMRKATGKEMGYIILPVVISPDEEPDRALDNNETFKVVWEVLRALRSHDDRFDLEINSLDLNNSPSERIILLNGNNGESKDRISQLSLDLVYKIPPGAIYARIVEKCGDRKYWPQWATDVAQIADRIRVRVTGLLRSPERITLREDFHSFLADLQQTLNPALQEDDLVAMVAQHLVTGPVFQALFADYDFVGSNPVSRALDRLVELLEVEGLENETRDLEGFYESVRSRAQALDNAEARQKVLLELYERFFQVALKKEAERLGIVYTPIEVVDFILHSADHALQQHFGRRLTDENVHILDPFTGTGTFIVRLLQNPELIRDEDLVRKFQSELHANEIVLLAYYIAAINIEEAYHGRRGMETAYAPFDSIVFTDTFTLGEDEGQFAETFPINSERVEQQQNQDITVITGNPPYSAGQKSAADDNPNVFYPHLAKQVEETYVAQSKAANKNSLYDSYKLAIRWASDRIKDKGKDKGIVAFVTNASFIGGNADAGLRACLADEYSHLYVFNLRGNQYTQGERSRQEGGKIFGSGSRLPVAIMVLVRDPAHQGECQIHYKDIGDYLSREEKLRIIEESGSIVGISDWQRITPDEHHDWLDQRDPAYQAYMPLGSKEGKSKKSSKPSVAARTYSSGVKSGSDIWFYASSRPELARRIQKMIAFYEKRRRQVKTGELTFAEATRNDAPSQIKWHSDLRDRFRKNRSLQFQQDRLRTGMYRPFVKQALYLDATLIQRTYQIPSMFPTPDAPNQAIGATGIGESVAFSTFVTDTIPNLHLVAGAQWFPRWRYEVHDPDSPDAWVQNGDEGLEDVPGYRRVDNITEWCLQQFRQKYPALQIDKDDIWHYIYGLLHAPDYREKYRADLSKDLPRTPFAPDFGAFRDAGEQLAALHLGYETCPEYELQVEAGPSPNPYQLDYKAMQWGGTRKEPDRSVLQVTPAVTLRGIPTEAHGYVVNGRTPLEWAVDRLLISHDNDSGIVNDPNAWFADDPAELVAHLKRLVHVSVETTRIVDGLPPALAD